MTAESLDYRRLGKQRLEARIIHNILTGQQKSNAWRNHPAVLMWKGYENLLAFYHNCMIYQWVKRGYNNTMSELPVDINKLDVPWWLIDPDDKLIISHRSNLLRKDPVFYGKYNWNLPSDIPYFWPTKN
jgi:hypothetical protein